MRLHPILLFLYVSLFPYQLFAQGLKIQGNDYFIEKRSSYTVFEKEAPAFSDKLALRFEIAPMKTQDAFSIGYILRIKNKEANTTYNIFYNDQGGETVFKFNHEGHDVLLVASLERKSLQENQWIDMCITFDLLKDSLVWRINDKEFCVGGLKLKNSWRPEIHFGRSEHVIDVPTFGLRNLTVNDTEKVYCFPLNENEGHKVHDSHRKAVGSVENPVWLINDAYYWKKADLSLHSHTVAGAIVNLERQKVYFFNEDSITCYDTRTQESYARRYANQCPMPFRMGTSFIDKKNDLLYVYEAIPLNEGEATMACLDLKDLTWNIITDASLPIQLHHHSSYLDEANRRYIIFGGFGNTFYSKHFYAFDLDTRRWETLDFEGDRIPPRYFCSMGYQEKENALYVFGGMGNESGDQFVGRVYYYDLYKIDLNENRITKLWEIPWTQENVVPVRGMVPDNDGYFYTLCYPEHFSKTLLKLFRFSIEDGSFELFGDSIPIVSEKIKTNANLYYDRRNNELYTIVQEFEYDDIASDAKLYSLSFPPVTLEGLVFQADNGMSRWIWLLIGGIALCLAGALLYRKQRKRHSVECIETGGLMPEAEKANSIYLFGGFLIRDRDNRDISYMFSTKLKQAFFLILQYSRENGITTQEFSELLWPEKSEDKVKNSRGVIMNNLRKILNDLDGIKVIHEKGFYKVIFTDKCYCDYTECLDLLEHPETDESMERLTTIVSRGKFLRAIDIPLLDSFKEGIERSLEPMLLIGVGKAFSQSSYQTTITLCEALFHIDPLSEEAIYYLINALMKLKASEEAKRRYLQFTVEYKKTMNEEYPKSFSKLCRE